MDLDPVLPEVFVGSLPSKTADIDSLRKMKISAVLNLQTTEDETRLTIDWPTLQKYYQKTGLTVCRIPVRDFDEEDLLHKLPDCVEALDQLVRQGHKVFVHCSAGAGRSPSVVTAYMNWVLKWDLATAQAHVQKCRFCSPHLEIIQLAAEKFASSKK